MENKIENVCHCGKFTYDWKAGGWGEQADISGLATIRLTPQGSFCPVCGYHLRTDGWAEPTAVINSDLQVVFRGVNDTGGECYFPADSGGECWSYPQFALIPLLEEVPDAEQN